MKTLLWILTGAAVAVALVAAWLGFSSAQAARTALADLSIKRAKLATDITAAQERFTAAGRDETELRAELKQIQAQVEQAAAAQSPAKPAGAAAPAPAPQPRPDVAKLLDGNPELQTLFRKSFQANLALRYLPLYDAAGLSRDQIQRFEKLLTESEEEKLDLQATANAQGLSPKDPALAKMRTDMDAKLQASQKEILGDAGYEQLQQYKRTEPLINFVNDTASLIAHSSSPLTAPQAEQLLTVLATSSSRYQAGGAADQTTIDWPHALEQAQTFLSPGQYAALKANSQLTHIAALMKQFYEQKGPGQGR